MHPPAETFRHEALFYEGVHGFVAGTLPFIRDAVAAGRPILVAVESEKIERLRAALGADADAVRFADMTRLGRNPGRIIPAWHAFLDEHRDAGAGVSGIGEPIWAGRTAAELVECQLHESLLNVAFADRAGFRLMCPYDVGALDERVVHEARCSHPAVIDEEGPRESRAYRTGDDLLAPFDVPLPTPTAPAEVLAFDQHSLREVRQVVAQRGERAGLPPSRTEDLVLAANEVAANSLRHGGGRGVLRVWRDEDALACEVTDRGHIADPLVGRRPPRTGQVGGWGVWIAHQICDLVQVRTTPRGTVVRLTMRVG
jgi:anti-sigma regulatory factor (Ser/Thr protein kinase)